MNRLWKIWDIIHVTKHFFKQLGLSVHWESIKFVAILGIDCVLYMLLLLKPLILYLKKEGHLLEPQMVKSVLSIQE